MATSAQRRQEIAAGVWDDLLRTLYGSSEAVLARQRARWCAALTDFERYFGPGRQVHLYTAPGRAELGGNHTDHQHGYGLAAAVSVFNLWLLWVAREIIPTVFGASPDTVATVSRVLIYFSIGALALSFCRVTTSYFYSIRANRFAYVMVYGEPVLLTFLLTTFLPRMWGMEGVWLATPAAQFLLAGVGAVLLRKNHGKAPALQPEMT